MKKLLITGLLLLIFVYGKSQTYKIDFPNGEQKTFKFTYDDPTLLPKIQLEYSFFGFYAVADGSLVFQLKPIYRMSDKLWFDGQLTMPYFRRMDGTIDYRKTDDPTKKLSIDFSPLGHFKLWSKVKAKDKYHPIDYQPGHEIGSTTIYKAKLPRKKEYALELDFGLNYNRSNAASTMSLEQIDYQQGNSSDTTFNLRRYNSTSLIGGVSYRSSHSYEMETDGTKRRYWRYTRFYLDFSYALVSNYHAYESIYDYNESSFKYTPATEGFIEPSVKKFGWRFGMDMVLGFMNSNFGMALGFEFGEGTQYSVTYNGNPYRTPSSIGMFHVGIVYGKMPKK